MFDVKPAVAYVTTGFIMEKYSMKNSNEISMLMRQAIQDKATPGVSYLLEDMRHKSLETNFMGYKTYDKDSPVEARNFYDLASLTKVIGTTSRIFQLIGDNKIKIDDDIKEYLPKVNYPNVTIKNLLMHNSGLVADLSNVYSYSSKDEIIKAIYNQSLVYPTGKDMIYSDLNFILLGLIIEKVDGMSLDKSLNENLFQPLEMSDTGYCLKKKKSQFIPTEFTKERGIIQGQVHDETAYMLDGVSGNAGLFSTVEDLKKFCEMYLNNGEYKGKEIIPANMLQQLFKYNFCGRTLGWQRWNTDSKTIWHTGFTGTSIAINFDNDSFFVCLANSINPTRKNKKWISIRRLAISLFFNQTEKISHSLFK